METLLTFCKVIPLIFFIGFVVVTLVDLSKFRKAINLRQKTRRDYGYHDSRN